VTEEVPEVAFSWDADTKVYRIESTSTDADTGEQSTVEAYTAKTEMRKLSGAIEGDYFGTGNSLLKATGDERYRNYLYKESSATVETDDTGIGGIPTQGMVEAAFLYWSGWIDWHNYDPEEIQLFFNSCSDLSDWDYGSDWHESGVWDAFYADHESGGGRSILLKDSIDLSAYAGQEVYASWSNWSYYSYTDPDDCLEYGFNGGSGWDWFHSDQLCGDLGYYPPSDPPSFRVQIPDEYLTDDFKIGFRIENYSGYNEFVYLDDVAITVPTSGGSLKYPDDPTTEQLATLVEESARVHRVRFGTTEDNTTTVLADQYDTLEPDDVAGYGLEDTWFYNCLADVTSLVNQWIEDGDLENNAAGTYTLGHVIEDNEADPDYSFELHPDGETTGYPLGTPACESGYGCPARHNSCYAGWSLLLIYSSPQTQGHQLYLYDIQNPNFDFFQAWHCNPDFDGDGEEGGRISGFLVPEPIEDEQIAAKLTLFVGEGDDASITSDFAHDYCILEGTQLENDESPPNDVWNGASPGLTVPGVDIDTFQIAWDDGIIEPGDTSAQLDLPTGDTDPPYGYDGGYEYNLSDSYTVVYIILSFRSETKTGGTISYLIQQ
jgi:hypothetical protein